jgi:hypothetical protein
VGRIATAAGFTFRFEDHLESGERPGDLLIESWEAGRDCAVDVTCVHALNLSANWISDAAAVDLAEQAKDTHYATACEQAGLCWTPAGMDAFGACGKKGLTFFAKLFDRYAKRCGEPGLLQKPGQPQRECWERLLRGRPPPGHWRSAFPGCAPRFRLPGGGVGSFY